MQTEKDLRRELDMCSMRKNLDEVLVCDYCDEACPEPIIAVTCGEEYLLCAEIEDGKLCVRYERCGESVTVEKPINYCTMCGRDLRSES